MTENEPQANETQPANPGELPPVIQEPVLPPGAPLPKIEPTGKSDRIQLLDVFRGVAILGILLPNLKAFSMIGAAYNNPTAYGSLEGFNYYVYLFTQLFCEQKFWSMFAMLFGAGVALMYERAKAKGARAWPVHYRRMFWLMLIGLFHAHVMWFGDILFAYALCGMWIYLFLRLPPIWLFIVGGLFMSVASLFFFFSGWSTQFWGPAQVDQFVSDWKPDADRIQAEVDAYRGSWIDQVPYRNLNAIFFELLLFPLWVFWRTSGLMMIGMGLYKTGFITGKSPIKVYLAMIALALFIAFPLIGLEIRKNFAVEWTAMYSMFYGSQCNYWCAPMVTLAYLSVIALAVKSGALSWVAALFAAVGRMALTNYLMQTMICITLFYGFGLGWFGSVERSEQLGHCNLYLDFSAHPVTDLDVLLPIRSRRVGLANVVILENPTDHARSRILTKYKHASERMSSQRRCYPRCPSLTHRVMSLDSKRTNSHPNPKRDRILRRERTTRT